jgi:hypothetical protein
MTAPDQPNDPIAILGRALNALTGELKALREDVQADARARVRKQHTIMAVLVVLVGGLALVGLVSVQNRQIAQQTKTTNAVMVDCTTPGGGCYRANQARTRQAIQDVIRTQVYVAECARLRPDQSGPLFDAAIEVCVAERLAADRPTPSASPTPGPSARPTK